VRDIGFSVTLLGRLRKFALVPARSRNLFSPSQIDNVRWVRELLAGLDFSLLFFLAPTLPLLRPSLPIGTVGVFIIATVDPLFSLFTDPSENVYLFPLFFSPFQYETRLGNHPRLSRDHSPRHVSVPYSTLFPCLLSTSPPPVILSLLFSA